MPQGNENIILNIASRNYIGWKSATVRKSIKALAGSFTFVMVDSEFLRTGQIKTGDRVEVAISDRDGTPHKVLTGFIDQKVRTKTGEDETVTITGREITADLVDCTAIVKSNTWTGATLSQIVTDICRPFGINVLFDSNPTEIFKKFTIQSGDTAFTVIDRVCRMRSVVAITNAAGAVVITNTGNEDKVLNLELGQNLKTLTETEDVKNRYSVYTVKGQTSGGGGAFSKQTTEAKGTATDPSITRYRPLTISAESKSDSALCQKRANWEAQYRAGSSLVYDATVLGWFQEQGGSKLWEVNKISTLIAQDYGVNSEFVISEIVYMVGGDVGRGCSIKLESPIVFEAQPRPEVQEPKGGIFG